MLAAVESGQRPTYFVKAVAQAIHRSPDKKHRGQEERKGRKEKQTIKKRFEGFTSFYVLCFTVNYCFFAKVVKIFLLRNYQLNRYFHPLLISTMENCARKLQRDAEGD